MMQKIFRFETLLFTAAFLLALVLRLASIGRAPLSDTEASLALQALALARGEEALLSAHPLYLALTTGLMFLFGASEFSARFWPAVAGSFLVLCPALFVRQIGRFPAILLAFLIAFDPALLAVSITAGSPVFAVLAVAVFAYAWLSGRSILAGISAGLALVSGTGLWIGLVGIGLVLLLGRLFTRRPVGADAPASSGYPGIHWRQVLTAAAFSTFLAGTFFFAIPGGLNGITSGMVEFARGWAVPGDTPGVLPALGLVVYEFLLIFLGFLGIIRAVLRKDRLDLALAAWGLLSLVIVLVYPARQMVDLVWFVLPIAVIAARQAGRMFTVHRSDRLPVLGQAALSAVIVGFISLTLLSMVNNPQYIDQQEYWVRLAGAVVMLVASAGLIGWGWSTDVSRRGLAWGFTLLLLVYSISAIWNLAGLSSRSRQELWYGKQAMPEQALLLSTIDELNQWSLPVSGGQDVAVVGVSSPTLRWALRNVQKVESIDRISPTSSPAIVITPDQPDLALSAPYRGQSFLLRVDTGWRLFTAREWLRWIGFRVVPAEVVLEERIILWARTDLFSGEESADLPQPLPEQPVEEPQ